MPSDTLTLPDSPLDYCCGSGVHDWRPYRGDDGRWDEECRLCGAKRQVFSWIHHAAVRMRAFPAEAGAEVAEEAVIFHISSGPKNYVVPTHVTLRLFLDPGEAMALAKAMEDARERPCWLTGGGWAVAGYEDCLMLKTDEGEVFFPWAGVDALARDVRDKATRAGARLHG